MSPFYDISLIDLLEEVQKALKEVRDLKGLKERREKHISCAHQEPHAPRPAVNSSSSVKM